VPVLNPPPPGDPRHGTYNTYHRYRCRCEACKAAERDARTRWYLGALDDDDPRHGTEGGYSNHRCRCPRCREATRVASQARQQARQARQREWGTR
jgi:hypothetical protein